jgi:NitT/TauT family transport system ATP-binding protein
VSEHWKFALRDVWKSYAKQVHGVEQYVLRGVDLEVAAGEFVCLVGHSGCGKSTILNLIAGYIKPDKGRVLVDGEPVSSPGPDRGVVFQEHALFPWYTVLENIAFGPLVRHCGRVAAFESADKYLKLVGLQDFAKAYPDTLSGGMKQRVGIARALANEPSALLMDEPFGALDALTRDTMRKELLRIWLQLRPTVVFVTHSVPEAVYLADQVAVMQLGRGSIHREISIDLPRPRDTRSQAFLDYVDTIEALLSNETDVAVTRE